MRKDGYLSFFHLYFNYYINRIIKEILTRECPKFVEYFRSVFYREVGVCEFSSEFRSQFNTSLN